MAIFWGSSSTRGVIKEQAGQIEALEKAVEGLETAQRLLKTEWLDVYDRMNRVMGRLNARIRKSEATSEPEGDPQPVQGAKPPGDHAILSEMRRRRSNVLPG